MSAEHGDAAPSPLSEYMDRLEAADGAEALAEDMQRRGARTVGEYMQMLNDGAAS